MAGSERWYIFMGSAACGGEPRGDCPHPDPSVGHAGDGHGVNYLFSTAGPGVTTSRRLSGSVSLQCFAPVTRACRKLARAPLRLSTCTPSCVDGTVASHARAGSTTRMPAIAWWEVWYHDAKQCIHTMAVLKQRNDANT